MKKLLKRKLWGALTAVFSTLLVIAVVGNDVAIAYAPAINNALGISTSKIAGNAENDYTYFASDYDSTEDLTAYLSETGILTESEGIVLLKNDNKALPLSKGEKVSTFFTGSVNFNYSSSGSSAARTTGYPTLMDSLTDAGFEVNQTLWDFYKTGAGAAYGRYTMGNTYLSNEAPWDSYDETTIASISKYGTAIVTIARDSGEGKDITTARSDGTDGSYLSLSEAELSVLRALTDMKQTGTVSKIIVLLNGSCTVQLDFLQLADVSVDACLWVGNVGSSGIYAIGQILSGQVNPSGHASDTWLNNSFSSPAMASWMLNSYKSFSQKYANAADYGLNSTQENYGVYAEGIYVGYRYYETRYADYVMGTAGVGDYSYTADVTFPFGWGLSYTDFAFSNYAVTENADGTFTVSVTVTNTGDTAGRQVAQIYVSKPYTDYDRKNGVEKAAVELVGFAKTGELAPGASETVTITVEKERFKSYDASGAGTYILDAGDYLLTCAADAHSAVNNVLTAQGCTAADGRMDADGDAAMTWAWNNPALDTTTYAVSTETGAAVTNQLDNADINRYEGSGDNTVTYVSRSDWEGTWPSEKVTLSIATEQMAADILSNKALPETDETMPTYGADNGLTLAALIGADYDDERWESLLDQMTYAEQAALVTTGQFATVSVESVGKPATKENDGPTGVADTTTDTSFPSEGIWASTWNTDIIRRMGNAIAEDALAAGETGMYAGGVNIHRTPFDGRSHEYFSEDPVLTGISIAAEVEGMQSKGVVAHVKHFAFNEEETNRNGICVWLNEQEARELMLLPFEYAVNAGTGAIMTSFNRAGVTWTGADSGLMLNILHDEWGFTGYNITDMANSNGAYYMTWDDGVMNGTDLYLGSADSLAAYSGNAAYANRLRQACKNILYTIANKSAAMNGLGVETAVVTVTPWWQTTLTVALCGLSVLSVLSLVLYALSCKRKKPYCKNKT